MVTTTPETFPTQVDMKKSTSIQNVPIESEQISYEDSRGKIKKKNTNGKSDESKLKSS